MLLSADKACATPQSRRLHEDERIGVFVYGGCALAAAVIASSAGGELITMCDCAWLTAAVIASSADRALSGSSVLAYRAAMARGSVTRVLPDQ